MGCGLRWGFFASDVPGDWVVLCFADCVVHVWPTSARAGAGGLGQVGWSGTGQASGLRER